MTPNPPSPPNASPRRPGGWSPDRPPTSPSGADRLKATIRRLRRGGDSAAAGLQTAPPPLRPEPTNAFEIAIAQRLKDLEAEIDRLRTQVNWLLLFIVAAALTNVVISLLK